jgi:integrase/recombinase XerC
MTKIARQIGRINWSLDVDAPKSKPYRDTRGPGFDGWKAVLKVATDRATTPKGKRDVAILLLMHDRGLRRGECLALDLADVELDDVGAVNIIGKGNTETERLTISDRARNALRDWVAERGSTPGPLFVRLDAAATEGLERLTGESVWRMTEKLGSDAGLKRGTNPHGFRHQGITRLLDKGKDVRDVKRFSRHAKLETLMLYDDARRDEAGALSQLLGDDD